MENLKEEMLEYELVEEYLAAIKKEFRGGEEESVKVAELKKLEQGGRIMEEFVQKFKRAVRGSRYKERLLIEEFKRGMNKIIRKKLMETERPPTSIEQWYEHATNLNKHWRESKREEKRIKNKREQRMTLIPKQ